MAEWGHIKLFSTWRYNIDSAARRLLETPTDDYAADWEAPRETRLPTGADMVAEHLKPLAEHPALAPNISYGHSVTQVTRIGFDGKGFDKASSKERAGSLFVVRTETATGTGTGTVDVVARAVIDASGRWHAPNPVGRSGIESLGEFCQGAHPLRGPSRKGRLRAEFQDCRRGRLLAILLDIGVNQPVLFHLDMTRTGGECRQ